MRRLTPEKVRSLLAPTATGRQRRLGKRLFQPKKNRKLSKEARAKIAEALRKRWADQKKRTAAKQTKTTAKEKAPF